MLAIRHGETDWNVAGRIQGHVDEPLNARGRWQAERLAAALADEPIAAIYSSDLRRARATAEAIARATGVPVIEDRGLRERAFGAFEGHTFEQIAERWPELAERWRRRDPAFGAPDGGEVLEAFHARSVEAAERLAARHPGRTIALVAHGGVLDGLYRAATRIGLAAPRTWQVGNATINRLLHTAQGLTLVGWSDAGHLDGAPPDEAADVDAAGAASAGPAPG